MIVDPHRLERGLAAVFANAGMAADDAAVTARHLVEADLRGHPSHGVGLMPGYVAAMRAGEMRLDARLTVVRDDGPLVLLDAGSGPGQPMAHAATALAIERAGRHGLAAVGLRDAYHIGRIGHWAEQCAAAGLVSLHVVNVPTRAVVVPHGGAAARLGTNPFTAAFPRRGAEPIVVDFATSRWAMGKMRVAMAKGETVPDGYLLDADGRPTGDPSVMFRTPLGALLPFGEHKGSALALAVELLAGALLGGFTQSGASIASVTNSMLTIAFDPAALAGADAYAERVEALAAWVATDPGVLLPGDPERARRSAAMAGGLSVDPATWNEMAAAAASVGVADLLATDGRDP
jgi:uncharacterized oxidoreductase